MLLYCVQFCVISNLNNSGPDNSWKFRAFVTAHLARETWIYRHFWDIDIHCAAIVLRTLIAVRVGI